jgi:phosphoribosylformylglycinamidine cyclo-ligase
MGDAVIGLASSGLHANGYSLARKILAQSGLGPDDSFPDGARVRDVFLEPTTIYVDCVKNLLRDFPVKGMVHITGGGFYDNIPRVLPRQAAAHIKFGSWDIPPVFSWLQQRGKLSWPEMLQIFNCGIGYVLVVDKSIAEDVVTRLAALQQPAWIIGVMERRTRKYSDPLLVSF